jgi:hypothetical protein
MWSRSLLPAVAAGIMVASMVSAADRAGFELLSSREYQSELSRRSSAPGAELIPKAADFDGPTITVVKPDRGASIHPPVDIEVRFQAAQGASVNVGSLKIMYGFLRLDVTKRILGAPGVQVSAAGLQASGARLPSGNHKLVIEVADNIGRTGRKPLEFTVTDSS